MCFKLTPIPLLIKVRLEKHHCCCLSANRCYTRVNNIPDLISHSRSKCSQFSNKNSWIFQSYLEIAGCLVFTITTVYLYVKIFKHCYCTIYLCVFPLNGIWVCYSIELGKKTYIWIIDLVALARSIVCQQSIKSMVQS